MSGKRKCRDCGSEAIDPDLPSGPTCTDCGTVQGALDPVSEVSFYKGPGGVCRATSQIVRAGAGTLRIDQKEAGLISQNRKMSFELAKGNIIQLCAKLKMPEGSVDEALRYYKLIFSKFNRTCTINESIVAACVYIVCRTNFTTHMLLDLSEILRINVYQLGKTYLNITSQLHLRIAVNDPLIHIAKFADKLQFGDKKDEVIMTATRLIHRMKKDWINIGRRPSGICGAALLVAARACNFNRTPADIVKVVKVCEGTVRNRLVEFKDTPSGKLSIDDFMEIDLPGEEDPPSFKRRFKDLVGKNKIHDLKKEVLELRKEIEKTLDNTRKKSMWEKIAETGGDESSVSESDPSKTEHITAENTAHQILNPNEEDSNQSSISDTLASVLMEESESISSGGGSSEEYASWTPQRMYPTAESLGLRSSIEDCMRVPQDNGDEALEDDCSSHGEESGPIRDGVDSAKGDEKRECISNLDLTGVDDEDLSTYFLKPCEIKKKDELWRKNNVDFVKKLAEEPDWETPEDDARKSHAMRRSWNFEARTAGEAIDRTLELRNLSGRIDYNALGLVKGKTSGDDGEKETESAKKISTSETINPIFPPEIRQRMSNFVRENKRKAFPPPFKYPSSEEPLEKRPKMDLEVEGGERSPEKPAQKKIFSSLIDYDVLNLLKETTPEEDGGEKEAESAKKKSTSETNDPIFPPDLGQRMLSCVRENKRKAFPTPFEDPSSEEPLEKRQKMDPEVERGERSPENLSVDESLPVTRNESEMDSEEFDKRFSSDDGSDDFI